MLDKINEQGVSIVIGARNEYPHIAMTVCNLSEDMFNSGITKYEIIIMDNGSDDETSRFFAWKVEEKGQFWKYIYSPRGMVNEGKLRLFYDPVLSNVGTRNKGAIHAKYENIIFSDAHIIVRPGTVYNVLETLIKHKGIVHAPISWMGASSENPSPGYQYSYKVGEKIWGTWNKIQVSEEPFYIPNCGHAFLAVKRKQFLKFRGYPYAQRVYGGGEPYLDTKYYMLGSHSMMDPRALVYHLSAGRGYNWHSKDLLHNMFLVSHILGGEKWSDRILMTYYNSPQWDDNTLETLYKEAMEESVKDKEYLDKHKKLEFEETLGLHEGAEVCNICTKRGYSDPHTMRPWDYMNDKLHGHHRSLVQEFKLVNKEGRYFIGNTELTYPKAITLAKKYV